MNFRPCAIILLTFCLLTGLQVQPCRAVRSILPHTSERLTVALYKKVPGLNSDELAYGREIIHGLNYNSQRIFRRMCIMEGMNFTKSKKAWAALLSLQLSYEQVLSFEKWSALPGITIDSAITVLPLMQSLNYEAGKAFQRYCNLPKMTAHQAQQTIPLLSLLTDTQNKGAQALFAIDNINAGEALNGLGMMTKLHDNQARAAGALAGVSEINIETLLDALPLIRQLRQDDAWNVKTLFQSKTMTRKEAWFWLVNYFDNPPEIQEQQFNKLSTQRKQDLIKAFYTGGEELIWKINNLHALTNRFGFEVSNHELIRYSKQQLRQRFERLSPQVRFKFGARFYPLLSTDKKNAMISILRQATAADRIATARSLTSANIYALLSQGSELYDSSFRNILVPILKKRIQDDFADNLLEFLQATDSANILVSNFIVSLAQKGKLTTFFPENEQEQKQILELVAASAFKDEDSIILFSATLMHLLDVLAPSSRTFLIKKMIRQADRGSATFSRLITVILQYYLQEYTQLLGPPDRSLIARLVIRHGAVNLYEYLMTPFAQWKEDGSLSSISIFHPDDDGRQSFYSFSKMLLKSNYRPTLNEQFTIAPLTPKIRQTSLQLIDQARSGSTQKLSLLFNDMLRRQFSVGFIRRINGLTIQHATFVYSGETNQEQLIERFVRNGTEMLAQRGHSYWRSEQITDPLKKLLQESRLTQQDLMRKQRFLSLGSCGGIKAYTYLSRIFLGHVDILATIGTGLAVINDPYNKNLFEVIAKNSSTISWKDVARKSAFIFKGGHGRDYLQPGALPALLHKILDKEKKIRR